MKRKAIYIRLTDKQVKELQPINKKVEDTYIRNKPGMAIGQLYFRDDGSGYMLCLFVEHETTVKILEITNPEELERNADRVKK
jgi:hypothetical protein